MFGFLPFNVGVPELILILGVALIIFGPGKLPELGRSLGSAIREFRNSTNEIKKDVEVSLNGEEEKKPE